MTNQRLFKNKVFRSILGVAFSLLLTILIPLSATHSSEIMAKVPVPIMAPALNFLGLDEHQFTLDSRRGKYTLVNFWALWCAPCKIEMPMLGRLKSELADLDLEILAVNLGDKMPGIVRFLKVTDVGSLKILLDIESVSSSEWHIPGLPMTYLVGPNGEIIFAASGAREWDSDESKNWFRKVLPVSKPK